MGSRGRLLIVATPIGNLDDLSPRAAAALRDADVVACEDTRRTATLLRHVGADTPMVPVHEHNEVARARDLVERVRRGATVVVVSDAGMPGVSDPGARIVIAMRAAQLPVEVVPGPSAVAAAIAVAGIVGEPWTFVGFFPRKAGERTELFERFDRAQTAIVGFESPQRVSGLLRALAERDPERPVAVCRELTKLHEEVLAGTAAELAERLADPPKGEVTVLVAPPGTNVDDDRRRVEEAVAVLHDAGLGPSATAEAIARLGLGSRNAAYQAALAAAKRNDR